MSVIITLELQKHTFRYLFGWMITIFNSFFNLCMELFNEIAAKITAKQLTKRNIGHNRQERERIL